MAMTTATALLIGSALSAAGAGLQYKSTRDTAKREDSALAGQIANQSKRQREADAKVNEQVTDLEGSTSQDERAKRLDQYMQTLRTNRGKLESGLTPAIGSAAFKADAAGDAADVQAHAGDTAGLMSRMDAGTLQRQGEAFGYGNLATDLSLIQNLARGDNFLDQLRVNRAGRRNAGMDAFGSFLGGVGGAVAGSGGSGSGSTLYTAPSGMTYTVPTTASGAGWHNAYGAG